MGQKLSDWGRFLLIVGVGVVILANLENVPIKGPNRQLQRSKTVANVIEREAKGKPFNLAVIAERNYEDAYEYFLVRDHSGVVDIDPQNTDATITDQLFVVCEFSEKEKCDPTHSSKAEVANFGWSDIEDEWQVAGVTLFKLKHAR